MALLSPSKRILGFKRKRLEFTSSIHTPLEAPNSQIFCTFKKGIGILHLICKKLVRRILIKKKYLTNKLFIPTGLYP